VKLPRLRRAQDAYAGSDGPAAAAGTYPAATPTPQLAAERRDGQLVERPPSRLRRIGTSLAETRRRVLPLPDEVIDQYLGHGERMIHNDHPSFRSFVVENTLLFAGLLVVAVLFLGIGFNGSLLGAGILLLILSVVMLVLVLKRLGDRYTSYVVTDTRIMRISGIISRRAHSIPWVRVTDLTIEQSLAGRLFGFATLHIESANEDSGLRDLEGVSDPLQFNQYVVDMVVAKQGATEPIWEQRGEPAPVASQRGLRRIRASRRREGTDGSGTDRSGGDGRRPRPEAQPVGAAADRRRVSVSGAGSGASRSPQPPAGEPREPAEPIESDDEIERLDAETLARRLGSSSGRDLPWRD
jgi:membrane protein YdbS with pleckstrin-like domain